MPSAADAPRLIRHRKCKICRAAEEISGQRLQLHEKTTSSTEHDFVDYEDKDVLFWELF
jgi:hypothetical protein